MTFEQGHIEFSDGYGSFYRYRPGDRGAVLYLHGIQSHGLWFEGSGSYLADKGWAVLLPDRRGSGRNRQARGDVPGYRRWLEDLLELCGRIKVLTGADRVHLIGVSWGGKLAGAFARRYGERLASMALVGPGICPSINLPRSKRTAIGIAGIVSPRRRFRIPLDDPELFTNNPDRQEFIRSDADRLTQVTARFLCNSYFLDRHVQIFDQRFDFPVKLFLAGQDRIIDNSRVLALFRSWRARRKQLSFYRHASHTLEFEPDPMQYYIDLAEWLDEVS